MNAYIYKQFIGKVVEFEIGLSFNVYVHYIKKEKYTIHCFLTVSREIGNLGWYSFRIFSNN